MEPNRKTVRVHARSANRRSGKWMLFESIIFDASETVISKFERFRNNPIFEHWKPEHIYNGSVNSKRDHLSFTETEFLD